MSAPGLVLFIVLLTSITAEFVCYHWVKKVTNTYFFWAAIGLFCFIWLVVFRFAGQWSTFASFVATNPGSYDQSVIISKGLLLDVCPAFAVILTLSLVLDPTRKAARAVAPIALIGGSIAVFALCFGFPQVCAPEFDARYIFMGSDLNPCYLIMHYMQVVLSIGVLLNTPKNGWKGTLTTFIVTVLFYSYVGIAMSVTGARWNVSGLSIEDWTLPLGEYGAAADLLGLSPEVAHIIGVPVLVHVGFGIVIFRDYVIMRGPFKYGNAFSGRWYSWYNYNKFVKQKFL